MGAYGKREEYLYLSKSFVLLNANFYLHGLQ